MHHTANDLVFTEGKIQNSIVYKNDNQRAIIMAVSKDFQIQPHTSASHAMAIITEGEVLVKLNGKAYTLKQGDSIQFEKDAVHSLHPITDFKMYLIKF